MRRLTILTFVSATGLLASGCEPTCNSTCKKLVVTCEGEVDLSGVTRDDCEDYCKAQQQLYEDEWTDEELAQGFADMKRCITSEECEDIADGVCYDEDFYLW